MNTELYESAKRIFDDLLEAEPDERVVAIEARRARDPNAMALAEEWLRAHDDANANDSALRDLWQLEPRSEVFTLPSPGDRIATYCIEHLLSSGGMGVVFLAREDHPQRRVALKFPKRPLATSHSRERFRREAQLLGRLTHPSIARVYAAQSSDPPFIAMEYVEGRQLDEYLRLTKPSLHDRVRIVIRIARGLHHAHQKGIIHRDMKPANILVDADGRPKIIDFGIARVVESDEALGTLTHPGAHPGTPVYMSPEQLHGDRNAVDVRSDVYSLGLIAFEAIAGRRKQGDERDTLGRHVREARGDLALIVDTATQQDPELRYASADALASDLERWIRHEPVTARAPSTAYILGRLLHRNRGKVLVASILVTLFAVSSWLFRSRLEFRDQIDGFQRMTAMRAENAPRETLRASLERCAGSLFVDTTNPPIDSPGAYAMISRILLELGDPESARELIELGRQIPDSPGGRDRYMLDLAESAIETHEGRPDRATELFQSVMEQTRALVQRDADRRYSLFHRFATTRLIAEGFDAALETIEEFQEFSGPTGPEAREVAMRRVARRAYDEGYPRAALDAYLRLEQDAAESGNSEALRELSALAAGMQWRLGHYLEAEERYRDLIDHGQRDHAARFANPLGVVLRDSGHLDEARHWLQRALEHRRKTRDAIGVGATVNNLAKLAELEARYHRALELYLEAFECGVQAAHAAVTDEALIGIARLQLLTGHPEAAKEILRSQIAWTDRRFGNRPWRMGEIESLLGEAHRQSSDVDTATKLLRSGRDRIVASLGPESALARSAIERCNRLAASDDDVLELARDARPTLGRRP